ncbi:MAG: hypothetical protein ABIQ49_08550 [Gemmatimonadales bacterium]
MTPELVRHFDAAVAALPDQRTIGVAIVFERFLRGIEPGLVPQDCGPAVGCNFVAALVAVTEETRGPAIEVFAGEVAPLGGGFERHGALGVLVVDQVFARIAAVHADQPVEHQLERARRAVPVDRTDDGSVVRQVEAAVEVEVPPEIRFLATSFA